MRETSPTALPAESRPRERLHALGADVLSDTELLAVLLASVGPIPAARSAEELLGHYGTLATLSRCPPAELASRLGPVRAARLSAAFEVGRRAALPRRRGLAFSGPQDIYGYARPLLAHLTREVFHVLLLDTRHRLMADRRVAEGGLAACAISPRDVFEPAIREAAPAVVFLHNHPSGDPTPSTDDILLTRHLAEAAKILGISLLDHIVVSDGGYVSLAERGLL